MLESMAEMPNNPSHDHHFVPVFYLRNWIVAPEKKLVEYRVRDNGVVGPRWTGPRGTGYERFLYDSVDGSAPSAENAFMMPSDTYADQAMKIFLRSEREPVWTRKQRSSWSRFIMGMLMRHPHDMAVLRQLVEDDWTNLTEEMREEYRLHREQGMPSLAEEWWEQNRDSWRETARLQWLRQLIDNPGIGRRINTMLWNVVNVEGATHGLLTSDRPVCMSDTLDEKDAFIVMPLSPQLLFVGVTRAETLARIQDHSIDDLVAEVNREVVEKAKIFVFAYDTSQSRFVANRFGRRSGEPSWMERLANKRANDRIARAA